MKEEPKFKFFNEYGNPPIGGVIMNAGEAIGKITEKLVKEMLTDGASIVEIRAAVNCLSQYPSLIAASIILQKQVTLRND
jgi:hypothetical protein